MPNRMIYISSAVSEAFDKESNKSGLVNQLLAQHYNQSSFKAETTNHVYVKPIKTKKDTDKAISYKKTGNWGA